MLRVWSVRSGRSRALQLTDPSRNEGLTQETTAQRFHPEHHEPYPDESGAPQEDAHRVSTLRPARAANRFGFRVVDFLCYIHLDVAFVIASEIDPPRNIAFTSALSCLFPYRFSNALQRNTLGHNFFHGLRCVSPCPRPDHAIAIRLAIRRKKIRDELLFLVGKRRKQRKHGVAAVV